jgi:predicted phage terminase large subunit-like protein
MPTPQQIDRALSRVMLSRFVGYTFPAYQKKWFHSLLCSKLDALYNGTIKRLMIFVPPQHGKTELVSRRFPAYALGRNPALRIAVCTYSADLASRINRQVQRIIDDSAYSMLFPGTRLGRTGSREGVRTQDELEIVGTGGSLKSVGVGGPLTGNPVDIGIIDDPVKDHAESHSASDRNRKWEWYNEVFLTRQHNDSRTLLTMTRWHEDDLAGRILRANPGACETITLPYICEPDHPAYDIRAVGEALWPEKHSIEKAMEQKANSESTFASLLQQRPAPLDGGVFKRSSFKLYTEIPRCFDRVILSWDCAFTDTKTADYVVGLVIGKAGPNAYVLDMARGKWDFPETVKRIRAQAADHPLALEKLIEEKANGAAVISTLKRELPGIIPIVPTESKYSRAQAVANLVEAGNVYLPARATWLNEALFELAAFPNGSNDDIVDALIQALNRLYVSKNSYGLRIAI